MKKTVWTITFILLVAATLSACSTKAFPTGAFKQKPFKSLTYTRQAVTLEFRDDGTFTYMFGNGIVTEGTYSIEGDEITWIHDTVCDAKNAGSATYRWQHEDGVLSFELIGEDLCKGRRDACAFNWSGPK